MRNLKALGLALVAAFAMSAMLASAAQATNPGTIFGPQGSTEVLAHKLANDKFTINTEAGTSPSTLECNTATFTQTSPAFGATGTSEVELTPEYSGCKTNAGQFVTVTHNGCTYRFYHLTTTGGKWGPTVQIKCPAGKQIEVHVYLFSNHTFQVCTLTVPAQTIAKYNNLHFHHEGVGNNTHLRLTGTVEGITYTTDNCPHPNGLTHDGIYHVDWTLTGVDAANPATRRPIHLTGP